MTRAPRATSSQGMQNESGAKSGNWLAEFVHVDFVFNIIFLEPVRDKQTFFAQQHSFLKLEEFQLIILFYIFILVLNQPRKFNSFKLLSAHYPIK